MKYIKYLSYLLRHKWYVSIECFKCLLFWRGITHDLSKFLPSEFFPYANHFFGKERTIKTGRDETGYYKPTDTGDKAFDFAWLLHQKRNDHHWQWWVLPEDEGKIKVLQMSYEACLEMICDWVGAGKAQGYFSPRNDRYLETRKWYDKNKGKMMLDNFVRVNIEMFIDYPVDLENLSTNELRIIVFNLAMVKKGIK